jgi:antitoxin component YwqK of YwqJK toxin-antitoxin module
MGIRALALLLGALADAVLAAPMPPPEPPAATDVDVCQDGTSRVEKKLDSGREVGCQRGHGWRSGPFRAWHGNGTLATDGQYAKDLPDGWWRRWDEHGALLSEVLFDHGLWVARRRMPSEGPPRPSQPGDAVHPCPDGAVVAQRVVPELDAQWCETLQTDGAYVREGPWVRFTGRGNGIWESGRYHQGQREGEFVDRHGRAQPEQTRTFVQGALVASATWSANGVQATELTTGSDGRTTERRWNEKGQLQSETVSRGKEREHLVVFFDDGQKSAEYSYRDGQEDGPQYSWWPNGQLREKRTKERGRDVGTWDKWDREGRLIEHRTTDGNGRSPVRQSFVVVPPPAEWPIAKPTGIPLSAASEPHCVAPARPFEDTLQNFEDTLPDWIARGCAIPKSAGSALHVSDNFGFALARHGTLHGLLRLWNAEGRQLVEASYSNGELDGRSTRWNADGSANEVQTFAAGKPEGPFATWFPNGAPRAAGALHGGKQNGVLFECRESGYCVKREEYRDGKPDGTWIRWDDAGQKLFEGSYRDGKQEGLFTHWSSAGKIEDQGRFSAGQKTGHWVTWDSESDWRNGMLDGDWISKAKDGHVTAQGRYERGRRVGVWKFYDEQGGLATQGSYAWCAATPPLSVTKYDNGELGYEGGPTPGCKKGRWSYYGRGGTVYAHADFDETDPRTWADPKTAPTFRATTVAPSFPKKTDH